MTGSFDTLPPGIFIPESVQQDLWITRSFSFYMLAALLVKHLAKSQKELQVYDFL